VINERKDKKKRGKEQGARSKKPDTPSISTGFQPEQKKNRF
jgi:hypothetical protein